MNSNVLESLLRSIFAGTGIEYHIINNNYTNHACDNSYEIHLRFSSYQYTKQETVLVNENVSLDYLKHQLYSIKEHIRYEAQNHRRKYNSGCDPYSPSASSYNYYNTYKYELTAGDGITSVIPNKVKNKKILLLIK
jgi:hypothetical protein